MLVGEKSVGERLVGERSVGERSVGEAPLVNHVAIKRSILNLLYSSQIIAFAPYLCIGGENFHS